jgi:hypothetical protein
VMATNQLLTHLIDIQSAEFAEQYELGVNWSMYGDEQGKGPVPASYLVTNLKGYAERGYFERYDSSSLHRIGFLLGMYQGGVLEPSTAQLRPTVTTLAHLDHRDARRGYRAGRTFFFVDAEPHECRMTESDLLERLRQSVTEMTHWKDAEGTWFFSVGCLLGELSGHLFPMSKQERKIYTPQRERLEHARKRHGVAQEYSPHNVVLQEV